MLGEENQGWYVGAMGLNLDRVGASRYLISVRRDDDIINWAKDNDLGGHDVSQDPAIRDRLAELGVVLEDTRDSTTWSWK
jgi:alkylation response protein AidB-like acyl-CoA dehydrogenase